MLQWTYFPRSFPNMQAHQGYYRPPKPKEKNMFLSPKRRTRSDPKASVDAIMFVNVPFPNQSCRPKPWPFGRYINNVMSSQIEPFV